MKAREIWIDWMRVAACLMVMIVHATEPFYLGGKGALILTETDAWWASFFDSFVRACVPLFVVASSYLQFPLKYSTKEFFRRRAIRILIPFIIWSIIYAFLFGEPVENLKDLLLNFNYAAGHLWFVYMLLGIYLLMPLLSPWAERVGKRELQVYILICFATTFIPFLRAWITHGDVTVIYGPTGLPNVAEYPLWGVASWNAYGLFYYMSGFIGYLLIGLYLRRFMPDLSWTKTLQWAIPCWLIGFTITFGGFLFEVYHNLNGGFPVEDTVKLATVWETTWINDTTGVFLMTIGWLLLFRKITAGGRFYQQLLLPVSKASYGMYLCHIAVLVYVSGWLRDALSIGLDGQLGIFTTPVQILLTAIIVFIITAILSTLIQRIPKIGKYIIG